jgi:hypothetical protein
MFRWYIYHALRVPLLWITAPRTLRDPGRYDYVVSDDFVPHTVTRDRQVVTSICPFAWEATRTGGQRLQKRRSGNRRRVAYAA